MDASSLHYTPPPIHRAYPIQALRIGRILLERSEVVREYAVATALQTFQDYPVSLVNTEQLMQADLVIVLNNLCLSKRAGERRLTRLTQRLPFLVSHQFDLATAEGWGWSTSIWLPVHLFFYHPQLYRRAMTTGVTVAITGYQKLPDVTPLAIRQWLRAFLTSYAATKGVVHHVKSPVSASPRSSQAAPSARSAVRSPSLGIGTSAVSAGQSTRTPTAGKSTRRNLRS